MGNCTSEIKKELAQLHKELQGESPKEKDTKQCDKPTEQEKGQEHEQVHKSRQMALDEAAEQQRQAEEAERLRRENSQRKKEEAEAAEKARLAQLADPAAIDEMPVRCFKPAEGTQALMCSLCKPKNVRKCIVCERGIPRAVNLWERQDVPALQCQDCRKHKGDVPGKRVDECILCGLKIGKGEDRYCVSMCEPCGKETPKLCAALCKARDQDPVARAERESRPVPTVGEVEAALSRLKERTNFVPPKSAMDLAEEAQEAAEQKQTEWEETLMRCYHDVHSFESEQAFLCRACYASDPGPDRHPCCCCGEIVPADKQERPGVCINCVVYATPKCLRCGKMVCYEQERYPAVLCSGGCPAPQEPWATDHAKRCARFVFRKDTYFFQGPEETDETD